MWRTSAFTLAPLVARSGGTPCSAVSSCAPRWPAAERSRGVLNRPANFVSFFLRSPLEGGGELGIIAAGDMPNSAKPDGRERLTAFKAVEARLRRLGGLAFAADSKDGIAVGNLIAAVPAAFPCWSSRLRILFSPNVRVQSRPTAVLYTFAARKGHRIATSCGS